MLQNKISLTKSMYKFLAKNLILSFLNKIIKKFGFNLSLKHILQCNNIFLKFLLCLLIFLTTQMSFLNNYDFAHERYFTPSDNISLNTLFNFCNQMSYS